MAIVQKGSAQSRPVDVQLNEGEHKLEGQNKDQLVENFGKFMILSNTYWVSLTESTTDNKSDI